MRAILLALLVVGATSVIIAETPSAAACTGDPSVCGVKRSAECTLRDAAETLSDRACWWWLG